MNIEKYRFDIPESEIEDIDFLKDRNKVSGYRFYLDSKRSIKVAVDFFKSLNMEVEILYPTSVLNCSDISAITPALRLRFERFLDSVVYDDSLDLRVGQVLDLRMEMYNDDFIVLDVDIYKKRSPSLINLGIDIEKLADINRYFLF